MLFVLVLFGIIFLDHFSYNTSVQEHGYLNRYSLNELTTSEINQMYTTKQDLIRQELSKSDTAKFSKNKINRILKLGKSTKPNSQSQYYSQKNHYSHHTNRNTDNSTKDGRDGSTEDLGERYSYWSSEPHNDTPEIFITLTNLLSNINNIEIGFNKFLLPLPTVNITNHGSTHSSNSTLHRISGHSVLFRLNCLRCMPRGATLLIATVNAENYKSDVTSVTLAIAALRHLSSAKYLSQNILLLVTMRLPFSAGTRQFLHDYYTSPYFQYRSGTIHNAMVLDLGTNNCSSYLISYEGIDGWLPNQDIVNIFVEICTVEGLTVSVRSMWNTIFRMAVNVDRTRSHISLLERNINSFSLICKHTTDSDIAVRNSEELLLKSLVLVMRNMNNLDTVLERSFNFYYFVTTNSFISISIYSLVVPLLFIRPIVKLLLDPFFDNLPMILGVLLVFCNIFVGSIPAYLMLLRVVRSASNPPQSYTFDQVRLALLLLVVSYVVIFLFNSLLFYKTSNLFGDDYGGVDYISKDLLLSRVNNVNLKKFKLKQILLNIKRKLKFVRKSDSAETMETTRETVENPEGTMDSKVENRVNEEVTSVMGMGYYWYIMRLPDRLPSIELFLLYAIYFVSLSFLLGLSVLNWALSFLLSLVLLVPLNVISVRSLLMSKVTSCVSTVYFMLFTVFFYPFEGKMKIVRAFLFENFRKIFKLLGHLLGSNVFKNYKLIMDLSGKLLYISDHVFGGKTRWINSRGDLFLLRKIYSASENHILFGSYNIIILLFMFGIIAHILFLNLLLLVKKKNKVKLD